MAGKKRFYKDVAVALVDGAMAVHLDGRDLRSPAGTMLSLPNPTMAEAMAGEWAAQKDESVRPACHVQSGCHSD